ncbi:methylated-DNA--[protein]-cysteine S-methyltransferase [Marinicellulosiphila megalodicopiae]|uniref:methylated-DNA--[protein]-cysteine S-methyltransferase n=1 Tax=Marinicellulosiphila megalodicopiae TaxID=2724896 RepID=UPI003BB1A6C1
MKPHSIEHNKHASQYTRIAKAIDFILDKQTQQPSLDDIAKHVNLSPFHFQRLFSDWAGVSPKQFLQFTNVQSSKALLKKQRSILDTSELTGLSSPARLHDMYINIEAMTPGQYKQSGKGLVIQYDVYDCLFGNVLIASTEKGICYVGFDDDNQPAFLDLQKRFSQATLIQQTHPSHHHVLSFFKQDWNDLPAIKLHLKATAFQLKVWQALLTIPNGALSTYGDIAQSIHNPKASRAVGTAIGSNPVSFLIPCHRVIQQSGLMGGYMWGTTRKTAMIGWEQGFRKSDV